MHYHWKVYIFVSFFVRFSCCASKHPHVDENYKYFYCSEEISIPIIRRCDGNSDCANNLDELLCTEICPRDQYTCKYRECVQNNTVLDNFPDCTNLMDEKQLKDEITLVEGQSWDDENVVEKLGFRCANGMRIAKPKTCDGKADCDLGEDEKGCKFHNQRCNGVTDWDNGEDENGCYACNNRTALVCPGEPLLCLLEGKLCDGKDDCGDGADEINCDGTEKFFRVSNCPNLTDRYCRSGECYEADKKCDGNNDCSDGSDESECPPTTTPTTTSTTTTSTTKAPTTTPTTTFTTTAKPKFKMVYFAKISAPVPLLYDKSGAPHLPTVAYFEFKDWICPKVTDALSSNHTIIHCQLWKLKTNAYDTSSKKCIPKRFDENYQAPIYDLTIRIEFASETEFVEGETNAMQELLQSIHWKPNTTRKAMSGSITPSLLWSGNFCIIISLALLFVFQI